MIFTTGTSRFIIVLLRDHRCVLKALADIFLRTDPRDLGLMESFWQEKKRVLASRLLLIFSLLFPSRFRFSILILHGRIGQIVESLTPPELFFMKSRADSAVRRYLKEIQKFMTWCKSHNISVKLPFSVSVVSVYMARVYKVSKSYASLVLVHAALKWSHSFIPDDVQNPLESSNCHNFLEATKRSKSSPIVKKLPISPEIITKIVSKFAHLRDLRLACLCALGFAGFFRYSELSSILPLHLQFHTDFVRIFVPQDKNDAYMEGNYV